MLLLDHVSISVPSIERARPFYDAVLAALGAEKVYDHPDALGYGVRCNDIEDFHSYLTVYESVEANFDERRHWCFKAITRTQVVTFYAVGLANGGKDNGSPGLRSHYHPNYFAAFLCDPFGNRIEAVCHRTE